SKRAASGSPILCLIKDRFANTQKSAGGLRPDCGRCSYLSLYARQTAGVSLSTKIMPPHSAINEKIRRQERFSSMPHLAPGLPGVRCVPRQVRGLNAAGRTATPVDTFILAHGSTARRLHSGE